MKAQESETLQFAFFDTANGAEDYQSCMVMCGFHAAMAFNYIQNKWEVAYWR